MEQDKNSKDVEQANTAKKLQELSEEKKNHLN